MKVKIKNSIITIIVVVLFCALFVLNFRERYTVKKIVDQESERYIASLLAENFRTLSRDLTRYARAYCITKDEIYYDKYTKNLMWAHGETPSYSNQNDSIGNRSGKAFILHDQRLSELHLTESEKVPFLQAEKLSYELAEYEIQAMDSVKNGKIMAGPVPPQEGVSVEQFSKDILYGPGYQYYLEKIEDNITNFSRQYQIQSGKLFADYQHFFSRDLILQFALQIGIIIATVLLLRNMIARIGRQAQKNQKLMIDAMPIGCNIFDINLNLLDCNPKMLQMLGWKDVHDASIQFFNRAPEYQPNGLKSKKYANDLRTKALETGYEVFKWVFTDPQDNEIFCEVTLLPVKQGKNTFLVSYVSDVMQEEAITKTIIESEAKMIALREAGKRMQQMINAIPVGITIVGEDLELKDCNEVELKMVGLKTIDEYKPIFYDLSPKFQPNGEESKSWILGKMRSAHESGVERFEWYQGR
ncbi:MAG: PAS domain-containing protein, partial [Thermoguttaceae bacterium]